MRHHCLPLLRLAHEQDQRQQRDEHQRQKPEHVVICEHRCLLLHHSRVWPNSTLGMEDTSRVALDKFLADQNIRVILTGHIHVPALHEFVPAQDASAALEARCGTTTVRDIFPSTWTTILGKPLTRTLPPNSLLVHLLRQRDGELWWEAEIYTRTALGFRPFGAKKATRVWP